MNAHTHTIEHLPLSNPKLFVGINQGWGQIHVYLYLAVFKYFFFSRVSYRIFGLGGESIGASMKRGNVRGGGWGHPPPPPPLGMETPKKCEQLHVQGCMRGIKKRGGGGSHMLLWNCY